MSASQRVGLFGWATPEAHQSRRQHRRVAHSTVQPRGSLLDFAHDHVRSIYGAAENRIDRQPGSADHSASLAASGGVAGVRETIGKHVEIGGREHVASGDRFEDGKLRDCEVAVHREVGLGQGNRLCPWELRSTRPAG